MAWPVLEGACRTKIARGTRNMKRIVAIVLTAMLGAVGCTSPENEGGTPIPGAQSGAPLADDAAGPGEQSEIEE